MLGNGDWPQRIRESWAVGGTANPDVRQNEYPLERAVSDYIRGLPFLWLAVEDPPGPRSDRGVIEAGSIALLSNVGRPPIDVASDRWLGRHADRRPIRESGLWNVNHVQDQASGAVISVLKEYIT
jgi:hypothetical protein